jgi:hexosaminidase
MKRILGYLIISIFALACNQMKRIETPDKNEYALSWSFMGNNAERGYYSALFILKNQGGSALSDQGWVLYFNQQGLGVMDESITGNVKIEHVNGDLLKIVPGDGFRLETGDSVAIAYRKPGSMLLQSQAPLHPYMVFERSEEGAPGIVASVDYNIMPFPSLDKFYPEEMNIVLPDAAWVYGKNKANMLLNHWETGMVLPTPLEEVYSEEAISLDKDLHVLYRDGLESEAGYLSEMLGNVRGSAPDIREAETGGPGMIMLHLDEQLHYSESYRLLVDSTEGIVIAGSDPAGVFYGIQTLLSMLPVGAWANPEKNLELQTGYINDRPAFSYRGFHLDIARNFIEPGHIKRLIRVMAYYKLNKLHLHMTDDEGWRLEIPALPELTEVGAFRGHTENERDHLIPAYGSGPDPNPEGNHGSGFLSRETFIELLKFADAHHVEIIPEINFPGHARAAIYAMEARYDRLMKEGKKEEAEYYRLIDPQDVSIYNSAQNFHDNVVCVCTEGSYRLFETVVDEVIGMYQEAGLGLKVLHTGGDEVPRGVWAGSPICQDFMGEHPEYGNFENLQAYFGSRIFEILQKRKLVMGGWEEIVMKKNEEGLWIPNMEFAGKAMLPYVWNSIYENLDLGNRLANAGFDLILCNVNNFYFDLAYTHHPAERGLYWGGFVNTRSSFDFIPFDIFKSTFTDKWGNPYDPATDFKGMTPMSVQAHNRVKGLQAELWSETVKGGTMAEYYYLPKLIGFAERAWVGQASWGRISEQEERIAAMDKDWNRFANIVGQRELPRLDYIHGGFNYRLPPPGAIVKEGKLHANIDFPGLEVRYTTDGTDPSPDSPLYTGPVEVSGKVKLRSYDTRKRGSRTSVVE